MIFYFGEMRSLSFLQQSVHLGQTASIKCLQRCRCRSMMPEKVRQRGGARCMAAAAQELAPKMTIPRQPGVTEGAWDRADVIAVKEALRDSQQASTSGRGPDTGEPRPSY